MEEKIFSLMELDHITFGNMSADFIIKQSVCEVFSTKMTGPNSVYDERMGPTEMGKRCVQCQQSSKDCVGHFGHIPLHIDIIHPLFYKQVLNFLKCVCYKCSRLLLTASQIRLENLTRFQHQNRFLKMMEKMDRVHTCSHCKTSQPKFIFSSTEKVVYMIFKTDGENMRVMLSESEIRQILDKIVAEDVSLLGFDPTVSHPRNLILTILPVLPPVCRPFLIAENTTCDDDLTIQYVEIIKANRHLADPTLNELKKQKYTQIIKFRIKCLFNNDQGSSKHSNGRPLKGIKKRLTGKEGLLRGNLLGKRVDKSARTVIGPDPTLCTDEIGVPPDIADILSYPVRVNQYNQEQIQQWIADGRVNFLLRDNGRTRINMRYALYKQGTKLQFGDYLEDRRGNMTMIMTEKQLFSLQEGDKIIRNGDYLPDLVYNSKKPIDIQIGDVIERRLMDGDILLLNRQPTLHKGSMIAQKIRIIKGKTIRLNLATTKTFNADFDGDEMNLHCPATPEAEAELRLLSSVDNNLISTQSGKANIVIVQDSLLGAYLMTLRPTPIHRDDFFQLCMSLRSPSLETIMKKIQRYQQIQDKDLFTGKMLFSLLLPDDFFYTAKNNADPLDPTVVIEHGLLLRGTINKSQLGAGHHSIITLLHKEYNKRRCIEFIDNVQFLTNAYVLRYGFSVGIRDCIVTRHTEIQDTVAKSFIKAQSMESTIQNKFLKEAYVMRSLANARDTGMVIAKNALAPDNNFIKTVLSGAKGDYFNISQITGLLGQQNLNGERIRPLLSNHKRSLYHYPHDIHSEDMRYEASGFIRNSFIHGLNPREYWFHSMTGREGITDTAMKSVTWETTLFFLDHETPRYIEIGRWIDALFLTHPSRITHHKERQMESMELDTPVSIPTMDEKGSVFWSPVTSVTRHDPGNLLYEITTHSGRTVIVTESKSLLVWDATRQLFQEKKTTEITLSDFVPVTRYLPPPPVVLSSSFPLDYENGIRVGYYLSSSPPLTEIPQEFLLGPEPFLLGILRGLLHLHDHHLPSSSPAMTEGLIYICSRLGLFTYISTTKKGGVCLSAPSLDRLYEKSTTTEEEINDVVLDRIVKIRPFPSKDHPKVYDLTIPSTLNFCLANGLQVRDTATSGYIQRRMIKIAEDVQIRYDNTVRNGTNSILQFMYGENGMDPVQSVILDEKPHVCNVNRLVHRLNAHHETSSD